jgi:hypothetical protein
MGFVRTARADSIRFGVDTEGWSQVRVASREGSLSHNLVEQASDILGAHLTPDRFLLSHATIVCSVDTEEPPNVRLGGMTVDGNRINRLYPDFQITRTTEKFANNNDDAWERKLLLKSYSTFVGGENYVEHVQIPEESKGKIVDAVARDIGPSVYVDILLATDRSHNGLIKRVEAGEMGTLSMGCIIDFSICTKCGHVSTDETNMCRHVRYDKGNKYIDDAGVMRRVAELCGHRNVDPHGGVNFIEASWVEIPAFKGAVMRNILNPGDISADTIRMAQEILSSPPKQWSGHSLEGLLKAASLIAAAKVAKRRSFDFDDDDDEGGGDDSGDVGPIDEAVDELVKWMGQKAQKRLKDQMSEPTPEPSTSEAPISPNESIIHEGRSIKAVYDGGLLRLARLAPSNGALVGALRRYNAGFGIQVPNYIYRTAERLGSADSYRDHRQFYRQVSRVLGRKPNLAEVKTLIRIAKVLSFRGRSAS